MTLYTSAPPARPFSEDKPTVLVSWWIAGLCSVVIFLRLAGRYVRVEKLFLEDRIAALFLIPLFLRTIVIHVVLLFGTNNILVSDVDGALRFSEEEIHRRSIGSGLVLLTRMLHPAALWMLKFVNLEFFSRLVAGSRRRYVLTINYLRILLVATFGAIVISDLAECRSFPSYWVVVPDPGGQCRQGYAHLLTTAICSALTDIMLVVFPVPIIAASKLKTSRKVMLILLFSCGLCSVAVSAYKVPKVLKEGGYQGTRSTWASLEIVTATFVANALALGSFVRDTGAKKPKFRHYDQGSSGPRSGDSAIQDTERGRGKVVVSMVLKRAASGETTDDGSLVRGGRGLSRHASRDSLISKGHASTPSMEGGSGVMKTTTIHVMISEPGGNLTMPTPPTPLTRNKSSRGRRAERRPRVVLQEMEALPRPASREQRQSV